MNELTQEMKAQLVPDNLVLLGYRGSVAHNLFIPPEDPDGTDDIDLMGVYLAPIDHYIGLNQARETIDRFIDEWDVVSYEFVKFVRLLLKSNPNVLSLLFLKDEFYLDKTSYGQLLLDNKDLFISKDAYFSFVGYAHGQIKKMESFNKLGYMGQKRKALVEKYKFDPKNASHCVRLLKMGTEFLEEGKLNVFREEDRNQLLDIKLGKWSLEEVKKYVDDLFEDAKMAFDKSTLPRYPNQEKANHLVKTVIYDYITTKERI